MGRRTGNEGLQVRLREVRLARGLSQGELAERAGLTRQAIKAIESARYMPNTAVALRLARALDCPVEDIFRLPEALPEARALIRGEGCQAGDRLAIARIGPQLVAYPLAGNRSVFEAFAPADGLAGHGPDVVRLLTPPDTLDQTALLLGCDPSLSILASWVARVSPGARLLWLHASSQAALDALATGAAHIAGSHLPGGAEGEYNLRQAQRALAGGGGMVVTYASWEQGFIVAPGNPRQIRGVADLADREVVLVNREPGSGSRKLLDELLTRAGVASTAVRGYSETVASHTAVARAVASGSADVGIGLEAVANAFGLGFVPLSEVRFDLAIPSEHLAHPVIRVLLDLLQGRSLRAELSTLPGYSTSRTGDVRLKVSPVNKERKN